MILAQIDVGGLIGSFDNPVETEAESLVVETQALVISTETDSKMARIFGLWDCE